MPFQKPNGLHRPVWLKAFQTVLIIIMVIADGILINNAFQNRIHLTWYSKDPAHEIEQIDIQFKDPDIIQTSSVTFDGAKWAVTVEGLHPGKTEADVQYRRKDGDIHSYTAEYGVTSLGWVYADNPFTWSGWKEIFGAASVTIGILCILLFSEYIYRNKEDLYSHTTPQIGGLALFTFLVSLLSGIIWLIILSDSAAYTALMMSSLIELVDISLVVLMPVILIFAMALSLSNVFLIAKEGFRFVNLLGLLLSFLVVAGVWLLVSISFSGILPGGDPALLYLKKMFYNLNTLTIYGLCFMLAVMICGAIAALRVPRRNADYIIILGCGIKPDGTLYPLIKSRVDRAIWFWNKQFEETGKKAIFVPSGGKGTDEIISEGEAMKNYLLSQGFKEEDILVETESVNTFQNMAFSKKLIDEQKKDAVVIFSTSNYHVFRSGIFARQAGLKATGLGSRTKWYFWPNAFVREFVGMMAASWKLQLLIFGGLFLIAAITRILI